MDEHLFSKSLRFLARRSRTEKEVYDFLKKEHASEEQISSLIADLKSRKFIDDEVFAKHWIEERMRLKPKGWKVLKLELKQKGISEEILHNYELKTKNLELDIPPEKEVLHALVEKKIQALRGKDSKEIYRKLGGFLMRRGFSFGDSKRAIDDAIKKFV